MITQQPNLKKLIQKVSSQLPQIQLRSLNNIYTKISHQIISPQSLLQYPQFPGVLMNWINENKKKSDTLLKVIYLLSTYTKFDKGLGLLRQYECLQFCEEFKMYLIQNERAVDSFTQQLQLIIKSLTPLGRSDSSQITQFTLPNVNNQNNVPNSSSHTNQKNDPKQIKINKIQIKQTLKFKCQNLPISQSQDKTIFQLLMKMKYANKQSTYTTLTQIRSFITQFTKHHFRCKSDLILYLCQICLANIFPQICISIISSIISGLISSQNLCHNSQLNYLVHLTYTKIVSIPSIEVQISLPFKIFTLPESYLIIQQFIQLISSHKYTTYLQYLLSINYQFSPQFLFTILSKLKQKQIQDHSSLFLPTLEQYGKKYPTECDKFLKILPQKLWRRVKSLIQLHDSSQKKQSYKHIQQYLNPKQFEITKNLHIMRQVINNLKKGIISIELSPKLITLFYLDVLLTLTISVSRQDPLMSYFTQAQQLFLLITCHSNQTVASIAYQELLEGIKNTKLIVNYPGMTVHRHEIIQIIFTSPDFTKRIIQCSLQFNQTLVPMLNIVLFFLGKDKFKIFSPFVSIFFVLTHHPNQLVNILSNQILTKMPKNYSLIPTLYSLFSTTPQTRKKAISQLLNIKQQQQLQILDKILINPLTTKNKQLKISFESIQNYLNIVLNPSLHINIKQTAINQFIDCIQRAQGTSLPDLIQAQLFLLQQIKKIIKKQQITTFDQKLILLHLALSKKKQSMFTTLSLQILLMLLQLTKTQHCKYYIFTTIYIKIFQSPFSKQPLTTTWLMMHFPHLQIVKMNIEQPLRSTINHDAQMNQIKQSNIVTKSNKSNDKFGQLYISLIVSSCKSSEISQQIIETMQEQIVSAVTTNNLVKISKLAFLFSTSKAIKLLKPTFKIILQYIRVNSSAVDIADQLIQMIKNSDQIHEFIGNFSNLNFFLFSLTSKQIGNDQLQKMLKLLDEQVGIDRIFYALSTQPAVKFSTFNEYNSLKLIQLIITTIRNNRSDMQNRNLALILLNRLVHSQFKISDHSATILSLINCLLFQTKLTIFQFAIILNCCSQLIINKQTTQINNFKLIKSVVQQMCTLIYNSIQQFQNTIVVTACLSFFNNILKYQLINNISQNSITQLIFNQPHNMLILAVTLIPKNVTDCNQTTSHLIIQTYTFLFLLITNKTQSLSILLNSTDILLISINIITPLSSSTKLPNHNKVITFDAIGRLLHQLSINVDQFIFKLNKVVRGLGQNSQYLLHYTLMAPIATITKHYSVKHQQQKLNDFPYIKMVCWICYIWKQETKILQDHDIIQQIISCILQIKQLNIITPLLFKSSSAQQIIGNSNYVSEKFKFWNKSVQQLICGKNKKNKQTSQSLQNHKNNIQQGLIFAAAIFTSVDNKIFNDQINLLKQTIFSCIKFIDQINHLLQMQQIPSIQQLWKKVLINLFQNEACSKTISTAINEGSFQTIIKLLTKIQTSMTNLTDISSHLDLLGYLSYNQSIRSMIIKNRIIQMLLNNLVAMDQNKIAKINYGIMYCTASFLFYLSCYKQTNAKIQSDKRVMDIWTKTLTLQQSEVVQQKILQLLINLATYKHSKATFMASKQIHKVSMGLLSNPEYPHKQMILMLLYNILYKNAAGIKMYKKNQVFQLFNKLSKVQQLHQMTEVLLEVINSQD